MFTIVCLENSVSLQLLDFQQRTIKKHKTVIKKEWVEMCSIEFSFNNQAVKVLNVQLVVRY